MANVNIEFQNIDPSGTEEVVMYANGKKAKNVTAPFHSVWGFPVDQIEMLLSAAQFKKYLAGKSEFSVPKWKIELATTGCIQNMTNEQNKWFSSFQEI